MALTTDDLHAISTLFEPIHGKLDKLESRIDKMESRMEKMDSEISSLKAGQLCMRKDLKEIDQKVSNTYELALEAFGTSKENRTWLNQIG